MVKRLHYPIQIIIIKESKRKGYLEYILEKISINTYSYKFCEKFMLFANFLLKVLSYTKIKSFEKKNATLNDEIITFHMFFILKIYIYL